MTGSLPSMTRSKAAELIEKAGGKVSDNVSKTTSFIVAGENPGSKLEKGIGYNIPVLDEGMFFNLLGMI